MSPSRSRFIAFARLGAVAVLSVTLGLAAAGVVAPAVAGASAGVSSSAASDLFDLTNASRSDHGLPRFAADARAAEVATDWSRQMAASGSLRHNPDLAAQVDSRVTQSWTRIGENVGVGYSAKSLHDAFMASSGHRANILGDFNRLGVGTATDSTGRLWVTLVFIKGPALATPVSVPFGNLDVLQPGPGTLTVGGWAIDADAPTAHVDIHVYVDGRWVGAMAAGTVRPDVGAAFGWAGSDHGWQMDLAVAGGRHTVCAYGIDPTGNNPQLSCRAVDVGGASFGTIDSTVTAPGSVVVNGWTIDPDTSAPASVHVYVNGRWAGMSAASAARPDVGAAFPAYGSQHGYSVAAGVGHGWHEVCLYGIDVRGGDTNPLLGCRSTYRDARPFGNVDQTAASKGGVRVSGWVVDPDTTAAVDVHVYIDGTFAGYATAAGARPDVGGSYPAFGGAHGFDLEVRSSPGTHQVCTHAIDRVSDVGNPTLRCANVTVPG